jgi:hypothetical protein
MSNIIIFYISIIPAGIALLIFLRNRKKLDRLMTRENSKYSGNINNSIDVFRILKTVNKSATLSKTEKVFLIEVLILIGVTWLTGIFWFILLFFFSEYFLD